MTISKKNVMTSLLLASLLMNLMLVGIMAGKYFAAPRYNNKRPDIVLAKAAERLPEEARKRLEDENHAAEAELTQKRKELKQQREQINGLLSRPKVGRAKLEAAYAEYRVNSSRIQELQHSITINTVLALSPEERSKAADPKKKEGGKKTEDKSAKPSKQRKSPDGEPDPQNENEEDR